MLAKSIIYKGSVYIYASRFREQVRIPCGFKVDKLNASGLLNKACGLPDIEGKNNHIKDTLKKVQAALDDYPDLTAKELTVYIKKGVLPSAPVQARQLTFLEAFQKFVDDSELGVRLTRDNKPYAKNTIKSYKSTLANFQKFNEVYRLGWEDISDKFYHALCEYYWTVLNCFDNHTGKAVKIVSTMLNWCYDTGIIASPINMRKWKVWSEDIEILVMYADEIKLLHNMQVESDKLARTRDIFLMGAFTCLRVEDLLRLSESDLLVLGDDYFINTLVGKTQKNLKVKLNPIAVEIIQKHRNKYRTLLPSISSVKFNQNLKDLAAAFKSHLKELKETTVLNIIGNDWEKDFKRVRRRRGKQVIEFIPREKFISSHCMRRSGITNLLMLGLSPTEVKTISGHSFNSRDFAKYVSISEQVVDKKSVDAWSSVLS